MFSIPVNPGAREKPITGSDYRYKDFVRATSIGDPVDWSKGHDTEAESGIKLIIKDQNGSSSCVGQGWSTYGEYLNFLETKKQVQMSARWIYKHIFLAGGGAYISNGAEFLIKKGFISEDSFTSYEGGHPPTETFMVSDYGMRDTLDKEAYNYQAQKYFYVDSGNINEIALAIKNHGLVAFGVYGDNRGWQKAEVTPPQSLSGQWGHLVVGKGFRLRRGKRWIKIHNSWGTQWGENGNGWVPEDYFTKRQVYNPLVLVDKPNTMATFVRLVKSQKTGATVFIEDVNGIYHPIVWEEFALTMFGKTWKDIPVETIKEIPETKVGNHIGFISKSGT